MGVYSSKALTLAESASVGVSESFNPLQAVIDIEQADHKLFEAVIETDFIQAYNEAGLTVMTESDVEAVNEATFEGIKNTIINTLTKIKEAVVKFFQMIFGKIDQIVGNDKGLVKQLGSYYDWEKVKDAPIKVDVIDYDKWEKEIKQPVYDIYDKFAEILKSEDPSIDAKKIEEINAGMENIKKAADSLVIKSGDLPTNKAYPDKNRIFMRVLADVQGGYKELKDRLKNKFESVKSALDAAISKVKATKKESKGSDEASKLQEQFNIYKDINKEIGVLNSFLAKCASTIIAKERAYYFAMANWARKGKTVKAEDKGEEIEHVEGEVVENESAILNEAKFSFLPKLKQDPKLSKLYDALDDAKTLVESKDEVVDQKGLHEFGKIALRIYDVFLSVNHIIALPICLTIVGIPAYLIARLFAYAVKIGEEAVAVSYCKKVINSLKKLEAKSKDAKVKAECKDQIKKLEDKMNKVVKSVEESTSLEEAYAYMIEMNSDAYVEEVFCF